MSSQDTLQRFLFEHAAVRGQYLHLDGTWQAILARHDYPTAVRRLLGETLVAAGLLGSTLKGHGRLVIQVNGHGPVNLLVAEATAQRTLRGMAQWNAPVPDGADLAASFGDGRMAITLEPQDGGERYQGIVPLEGADLAGAFEGYLARSEQLPTRLWLAVDGRRASGLMLQRIPGQSDVDTDTWERACHLADTVTEAELLGLDGDRLRHRLFHEEDLRLFEAEPVRFACSCSRERVAGTLRSLGVDEVRSIIAEQGSVDVNCEFCNRHFHFDPVDAEQLFVADDPLAGSPTRH
jgi:molecular chaperone Hsp33